MHLLGEARPRLRRKPTPRRSWCSVCGQGARQFAGGDASSVQVGRSRVSRAATPLVPSGAAPNKRCPVLPVTNAKAATRTSFAGPIAGGFNGRNRVAGAGLNRCQVVPLANAKAAMRQESALVAHRCRAGLWLCTRRGLQPVGLGFARRWGSKTRYIGLPTAQVGVEDTLHWPPDSPGGGQKHVI